MKDDWMESDASEARKLSNVWRDGPAKPIPQGEFVLPTPEITDKRGFAARWKFSVRTVDTFLAKGMPHLAIGKRRVRIIVAEADAWMRQRYHQRRNGTQ